MASQSSAPSDEATTLSSSNLKSGDFGSSDLVHMVWIVPLCPPPRPPPVDPYAIRKRSPILITSGAAPPPGLCAPLFQVQPSSEIRPPPPVPKVKYLPSLNAIVEGSWIKGAPANAGA